MLGYLTLAAWIVTIALGLKMHGVRRLPIGVVLPHAILALTGPLAWIAYLAMDQPTTLGWVAVAWVILVNGLGDAAAVRRWKRKADGGLGLVGTYVKRVTTRRILLIHLIAAAVTTALAIITVVAA